MNKYYESENLAAPDAGALTPVVATTNTYLASTTFTQAPWASHLKPYASTYNCLPGQTVTIRGHHLGDGASLVRVGGVPCRGVRLVVPEYELQCTLPHPPASQASDGSGHGGSGYGGSGYGGSSYSGDSGYGGDSGGVSGSGAPSGSAAFSAAVGGPWSRFDAPGGSAAWGPGGSRGGGRGGMRDLAVEVAHGEMPQVASAAGLLSYQVADD